MSIDARHARNKSIDPAWLEAVTREVIARLRAASETNHAVASINDRIVTANTIEQLSGKPSQLFIPADAIVTPAAVDEARHRRITINRSAGGQKNQPPGHETPRILDAANPARADAVRAQLSRRGTPDGRANILLSDTPAREVYQQCAAGEVAVMIASLNDVQRFADELSPTVWVLDMKRLNLPGAVNVIARVLRIGDRSR